MTPHVEALALSALLLATPASARAADDLAGHYYLNGVREVGSELLLKPEGRFQWYLSYGAMDQQAEGAWKRAGDKVVLRTDPVPEGKGWAYVKEARDWDAAAEYSWRRQRHEATLAEISARCPFLQGASAPAAMPLVAGDGEIDEAALRREVAAQQARLAASVRRAEETAAAAMSAEGAAQSAAMQVATQAMADYWREQYALKDLYWKLPEPPPRYATLSLPAECIAPSEPVRDSDPADWQPRAAVLVHDDDQGAYFNGVAVTFIYADGREKPVTTRAGGYAFAADAGAMPVAIALGIERAMEAGVPVLRLEVAENARPLMQVELETQVLSGPAFEQMELRIDAGWLIPTWPDGDERGRYSRD